MTPCLIDGNSLYARSYWAAVAHGGDLSITTAELFFRTLLITITERRQKLPLPVTHLLVCWDGRAKRDKQRVPKPDGYEELRAWVEHAVNTVCGPGTSYKSESEADDAIATVVHGLYPRPDVPEIYVVSGDKDLQQLVCDKVRYFCLNEKSILPHRLILGKWNVKHPSQIAIALAILGDSADKIDGIKGWGPKKVAKLFEAFTADTPLVEIAESIAAQVPPDKLGVFIESLELTALQTDLAGVPDPSPVLPCSVPELEALGLISLRFDVSSLAL